MLLYSLRSTRCGQLSQFTAMSGGATLLRTCDFDDGVKWVSDERIDAALEQYKTFFTEVTGLARLPKKLGGGVAASRAW